MIETSMASMTREFSKWMEANKTTDLTSRREQEQAKKNTQYERPEASPNSSQSNKRMDTRRTPNRDDPMITQPSMDEPRKQLFQEIRSPHGYDINRPQYLYRDNGDGSLIEIGLAGPNDFIGPRPDAAHDLSSTSIQFYGDPLPQSPMQTQDTHKTNETEEIYPLGQPSPQRETQPPVTGSPQSLPAAGAKTYHA